MITPTPAQVTRMMKSTTLKASPRLLVEWNLNRASGGPTVKNQYLATQVDDDYFSIDSVVKTDRPNRGIIKAFTWGAGAMNVGSTTSPVYALDTRQWSYTSDVDDQYKYWIPPAPSSSSPSGGDYALANAGIEIAYPEALPFNKILITFELDTAVPKSITIGYKVGSSWQETTYTGSIINGATGRAEIYLQSNGSFTSTFATNEPITASEFRMTINSVDRPQAYIGVIEFSPRLVLDMTDRIQTSGATYEVSEETRVAPIGLASSNVGNLILDNFDDFLSEDNVSSYLHKMHRKGAEVSLYVTPHEIGESPNLNDEVPIYQNMQVEKPMEVDGLVEWQLSDRSKILQERKPPKMLVEDESVAGIVIRMCHAVGFNSIDYTLEDIDPRDTYSKIKFFWTDDEVSVWENIQRIAEATQTAVYIDEFGNLQVLTRATAYSPDAQMQWVLDADTVVAGDVSAHDRTAGEVGKLADIITFDEETDELPNTVDVSYVETDISKMHRGVAPMEIAWEAESDVVLRAGRVVVTIAQDSDVVTINANDSQTWPYSGMFIVNGEVIRYDAKRYSYHNAIGGKSTRWISSVEEREDADRVNPEMSWDNRFNGGFRVSKRGEFGTQPTAHVPSGGTYLVRRRVGSGNIVDMPNSLVKNLSQGYGVLSTGQTATNGYMVAKRTSSAVPGVLGTRIMFPAGSGNAAAGIVVGCGTMDSGIYIELAKTQTTGDRSVFNELNVYWKSTTGAVTRYGGKGAMLNVAEDVWYDLDVYRRTDSPNRLFTIYVNGNPVMDVTIPAAGTIGTLPPEQGIFHRGPGSSRFEHFYHLDTSSGQITDLDHPSAISLAKGGFKSFIADGFARWVPSTSQGTEVWTGPGSVKQKMRTYGQGFYVDEFGLIAHEVRELDIEFENGPMIHSKPYVSNSEQVACPAYHGTAFGASMLLVNTSRQNAVANGEDSLTYGIDDTVDQRLLVYGRRIVQEEPQTEKSVNDSMVVKDGEVELKVDNEWIQTKEHATRLGDWIAQDWSGGERVVDANIFAMPYLQLLDLVGVQHVEKHKSPKNDRYYITRKSINYNGGLEMDITLRSLL